MIQTYTWHVDMEPGEPLDLVVNMVRTVGNGIMGYTGFLRGVRADTIISTKAGQKHKVIVSLTVYGKDRWAAQAHGRQIGEKVFKAARLWGRDAELVEVITEPNRRGLKDGEGRTPRPRPPRASAPSQTS